MYIFEPDTLLVIALRSTFWAEFHYVIRRRGHASRKVYYFLPPEMSLVESTTPVSGTDSNYLSRNSAKFVRTQDCCSAEHNNKSIRPHVMDFRTTTNKWLSPAHPPTTYSPFRSIVKCVACDLHCFMYHTNSVAFNTSELMSFTKFIVLTAHFSAKPYINISAEAHF